MCPHTNFMKIIEYNSAMKLWNATMPGYEADFASKLLKRHKCLHVLRFWWRLFFQTTHPDKLNHRPHSAFAHNSNHPKRTWFIQERPPKTTVHYFMIEHSVPYHKSTIALKSTLVLPVQWILNYLDTFSHGYLDTCPDNRGSNVYMS